jgi:hypothetical protein
MCLKDAYQISNILITFAHLENQSQDTDINYEIISRFGTCTA